MSAGPDDTDPWGLTPAEREVLELIADGYTDEQIAGIRVVSVHTVKTQVKSILAKMEVRRRMEAARLYRK